MKIYFYAIVCIVFINSLSAATPKELYLGRTPIKMLAEGLEFKPFRDMKAEQIKPLNLETLNSSDGTTTEVYDYSNLWQRDQKLATYSNKGVKLDFYKLNYLPPKVKFTWKNYVKEYDYTSAIVKAPWTEDLIKKWFKNLTNKSIKLEDKYPKLTFSIKQRWVSCGQKGNEYDFLLIAADKRHYYLHATVNVGDQKTQLKAITSFVKSIRINRARAVKASFQSAKVKPRGKMTDAYQATVKQVIQEVANTKGWWYAQTPNYILKSNLSSRSKSLAKKVQVRVEVMRKVFEAFLPPEGKIEAVSVITFPNTRQEYMTYSDAPGWSAGVWNSRRRELVVSNLEGSKRAAEQQMMNTLNHEAFHQYIFYALKKKSSPAWFNEGHADMFASVKVIGSKVKIIEDQYALRTLANHFKNRSLSLSTHINSGYEEFYAKKEINYPLSWSLVYFLRKAGPIYKTKGYDIILDNVVAELIKSGNMKAATAKGFYGIDMKVFQKDFYDFWNDKRLRSKAAKTKVIVNKR